MPTALWTPDSTAPKKRVRVCVTCKREFPFAHLDRFAHHVESCSAGLVEEDVKRRSRDVFSSFADPEAREWVSKRLAGGKNATKRGRLL